MSNIQVDMYFWQVLEVKYKSNSVPWLKEHAARYLRKLRENWRIEIKKNSYDMCGYYTEWQLDIKIEKISTTQANNAGSDF